VLNEPDERDPSGLQRKAALTAMAYQFLNTAQRKNIPVIVRLKELQPGDFRGLYAIIGQCLGTQLNEVFVSLNDRERSEALELLAQTIANRYEVAMKSETGARENPVRGFLAAVSADHRFEPQIPYADPRA